MNKEEILKFIDDLEIDNKIQLKDIPDLDLYMDQVIQLFEGKLSTLKRTDDDKVLTKTMINNYAKAKLLMSINNKKYSKEHLILMSLIYDFKGILSISDIKTILDPIVQKYEKGESYDLRNLYEKYLEINREDSTVFKEFFEKEVSKIKNEEIQYEDKFLLISSMILMSNMYRRIGEKLIDELLGEWNKNEKSKWFKETVI